MLFWAPWSHNQDPETFPEPGTFDPERFSEARAEHRRHAEGFAPQGMGPPLGHACPGIDYATLFMQVFAAVVLRDYSFALPEQDLSLDLAKLPPEHADGLRIALRRERVSAATHAATTSAGPAAGAEAAAHDAPSLGLDAFSALADVIWADGVMAEEEASTLVSVARAAGLGPHDVAFVERTTRERTPLGPGRLAIDDAGAEHLYALACLMAAADGTIDPRERAAVAALGDRLGLDETTRARASRASHAVAQAIGASSKALAALAAEMEGG